MKHKFSHPALEEAIYVSAQYVVCPCCNGNGTHFRKDLDESALIESMELDGDYEGLEFHSKGAFNQLCMSCNGKRVVYEFQLPKWAEKLISEWQDEERRDRAYAMQEKRFGA